MAETSCDEGLYVWLCSSFNDSTVYFTDVQQLEGGWVYEKERSFS